MANVNGHEHVEVYQVERAAIDPATLHLLRCADCAAKVLRLAATLESTPLFEYPPAD